MLLLHVTPGMCKCDTIHALQIVNVSLTYAYVDVFRGEKNAKKVSLTYILVRFLSSSVFVEVRF